ncbi:SdpI family protein [Haloactinomyces albus]|uniref:Membrane protein n=1 Tax=Haloactinomyces albus TaxID=1352928 RepID=A0AAE4CM55_9ACTN|nr:SdpI family protein [Haloactinomyces albus]MDR7302036.1 putative membrane protein [Haloactinomyces albus]
MTLVVQIILGAILVLGGAAVLLVGWRSLHGRLTRNRYVGVRTPATMHSEEAFELGNRVAAPAMLAGGAVGVLSGTALPMLPSLFTIVMVAVIGLIGWFALMMIGGVLGTRAAATVRAKNPASAAVSADPCGGCAGGCCGALQRG